MNSPTGATMVLRTEKVKDRVRHILTMFPQTKGDDLQLIWRYYKIYTPVRIKFADFKQLLMCPSPETIRRRRQEIQAPERKAVENGDLELKDAKYLPKEKTINKRHNYRQAMKNYYGKGLTLADYMEKEGILTY